MDITPVIDDGYNIIEGYGNKSFKINGVQHSNNLIVLPKSILNWDINDLSDITYESLEAIFNVDNVDLLLIGCGEKHLPLDSSLTQKFIKRNNSIEVMTTGAACRTYNVLLAEGRNIAAAIIAV